MQLNTYAVLLAKRQQRIHKPPNQHRQDRTYSTMKLESTYWTYTIMMARTIYSSIQQTKEQTFKQFGTSDNLTEFHQVHYAWKHSIRHGSHGQDGLKRQYVTEGYTTEETSADTLERWEYASNKQVWNHQNNLAGQKDTEVCGKTLPREQYTHSK